MNILNIKSLSLILLVFSSTAYSQNGLSPCGVASAIWNAQYSSWSDGQGACTLPKPTDIGVAGLNTNYFSKLTGSGMCGACFNLTGPAGSTIVKVVDSCNSVDLCLQTQHAHFIVSPEDYFKINGENKATMYNVGYQLVTCPALDDFKVTLSGATDTNDFTYYFSATISGFTVPIKTVEVTVGGVYSSMKYQGGIWVWNKVNTGFTFPSTMRITTQTMQQILFSAQSGSRVLPNFNQTAIQDTCPMPVTPTYIYQNALAAGWVDGSWFAVESNLKDHTISSGANILKGLSPWGGVKLINAEQFSTVGLKYLVFDALSNISNAQVTIFFQGDHNSTVVLESETFASYNVSVKDLIVSTDDLVNSISFQNNQPTSIKLLLANIRWVYETNVTVPPGVVTIPVIKPSTSTTAGSTSGSAGATTTADITTASTTASMTTTTGDVEGSNPSGSSQEGSSSGHHLSPVALLWMVSMLLTSALM
ncbi:hypothetical protein SAMD00019534_000150 [Acytostelium subglobosum LB1]|uniref:hypothetical protein n=1 Tax=Acytostelium subglobosum LB1 TaxID=1410327 RepID=UPI0006448A90|nr:hypothetical protein SAMD00019534_000150 [Acytostelium subglobosum LB1]GAM16840.1 hypothetical protein SAMD00019534_000150 [Acytostelium subglobosum LB1]|eukprot:XP_012758902.1 hypothetical protein SAMD00019534_000150 [Acytostelium subglobosum LB1]